VNLETLLAQGEAMLQELGREYYLTGAGMKGDPEFQTIYQKHAVLVSDGALEAARASGSSALLEWAVDTRVGRLVAPFEERQLVWEQDATVEVDGTSLPYLRVPIELSNLADRMLRNALDAARASTGAKGLASLRRERFLAEHEAVRSLGMGDYVEAVGVLAGIDLDGLGREAWTFLERTAAMYEESLARLVKRRLDIPVADLTRADSVRLFRADQFDAAFPADGLVETAIRQMREMGLDATQGGRVRFDTQEREGKQPRAFCVPVRVPEEVYLVLRPRGGHSDYRTFWHELGHAMHFASVTPDLPFAARWLGDNSVTEGYAMLWDHLTIDPAWLVHTCGMSTGDAHSLTFELAVGELFMVRRYAAKLVYELELHRSDFTGLSARYAELLSQATRCRYLEDDSLLDVDPGFYSARYLRAWQFESALTQSFVEQFDEEWYRHPQAGAAVHELMARGQADPVDELVREATGQPLGFEGIVTRLEARLS
jgi:hypothetical protein